MMFSKACVFVVLETCDCVVKGYTMLRKQPFEKILAEGENLYHPDLRIPETSSPNTTNLDHSNLFPIWKRRIGGVTVLSGTYNKNPGDKLMI